MKIETKYHGSLEVNLEEVLSFDKGIPGFLDEKNFIVLPLSDDDIFYVLQSISTPELAFVISSPFNFFKDYDFNLEEQLAEDLDLESENEVVVHTILTVQDPFQNTTANLQAPIIINSRNRKAKQVILHNEDYRTKHPIFEKTEVKG
jgi:flagellar assembly factor FliW